MKTRESGMPEEEMWSGFFQPELIFDRLRLQSIHGDVVEFGCGYGTFTIPPALSTAGIVHALDIEPEMVALTAARAKAAGLRNIRAVVRDFVTLKTGLPDNRASSRFWYRIPATSAGG